MSVIYIDVLVVINLAVDYFLLLGTAKIAGAEFIRLRGLLASVIGALYALIILFPINSSIIIILSRIIVSSAMTVVCFGKRSLIEFIRLLTIFYICGFIFFGFITAVNSIIENDVFLIKNGTLYFEISAVELVISAGAAYIVTDILRRLFRHGEPEGSCFVDLHHKGKRIMLKGFTDTGNTMTDPFSGDPVAICSEKDISEIIPEIVLKAGKGCDLSTGLRYLPYKTVSGSSMIPVFRPEKLEIIMKGTRYEAENVFIGISENVPKGTILLGKNITMKQSGKIFSEVR